MRRSSRRRPGRDFEYIDDGGLTGPAFYEHVRRLHRPVLNNPKRTTSQLPPDLTERPVTDPAPYWTWSLISRRSDPRTAVRSTIEALTHDVPPLCADLSTCWLPADDPYR